MNITTTIPDDAADAYQMRVDQYNASSGKDPVDIAGFCQINRDAETGASVESYAAEQLNKLKPLGEKYSAAPKDVQTQVDALLAHTIRNT